MASSVPRPKQAVRRNRAAETEIAETDRQLAETTAMFRPKTMNRPRLLHRPTQTKKIEMVKL